MKNQSLICLLLSVILFSVLSCKKERVVTEPAPVPVPEAKLVYRDSISFFIDGVKYTFNQQYGSGVGNHAINVKPFSSKIKGGKLAYETGNLYWYGEQDSTLYFTTNKFSSESSGGGLNLLFTKKFRDSQLQADRLPLYPKDNLGIFKVGKVPFAVDFDKENTMEGIVIDCYSREIGKALSTKKPGFSILVQSGLKNDIQNNSSFEITSVKKLTERSVQIEAKFELNFFDEDAKLYRAKNGFIQFVGNVTYF